MFEFEFDGKNAYFWFGSINRELLLLFPQMECIQIPDFLITIFFVFSNNNIALFTNLFGV